MIKKLSFLFVTFLLIINNLGYSQTVNPYADFKAPELKENAKYAKNFNPGNYDSKILYDCITDIIDYARKKYFYLDPLKHDEIFDSVAAMQATFQANSNEKTEENVAPYKTTFYRLKKYGLSHRGIEIVTKGRATLGVQDYSYYDASMELLAPIFKNPRQVKQLLDKQYTFIGIACEPDEFMKTLYASFILGNDRTFMVYKSSPMDKNLPISKGKGGLEYFDEGLCKKCLEDNSFESLSNMITVDKEGNVYLEFDDNKTLKKIIGRDGDGIVLDFILMSQYDCKDMIIDNDKIFRGTVSKPITFDQIMSTNESEDKLKVKSIIAKVPESIDLDDEFFINVLYVKDDKVVCRTIFKKAIEAHNVKSNDKVNFIIDEKSIPVVGEWVAVSEKSSYDVKIPFTNPNKNSFTLAEIDSLISVGNPNLPPFRVESIEVIACNSIDQINNATYQKNLKTRAESIKKALMTKYPGMPITSSIGDSWPQFQSEIVNNEEYFDISFMSKEEAIKKLKENNNEIAKKLEKDFLSKQRYAKIVFHVSFLIDGTNEQEFVSYKFNQAIEQKNLALAMSIQQYIIRQIEFQRFKSFNVDKLYVPETKQFIPFLTNNLYMQYYAAPTMEDKIQIKTKRVFNMDPKNPVSNFNMTVVDALGKPLENNAQILKIQTDIDKLYTIPSLPVDRINNLNMEFQIKILEYLKTAPKNSENATLNIATYAKIKAIRNPVMDSWEAAYKLANIFIKGNDYDYAIDIMTPFIDNPKISEDFLFAYISLTGYKEEFFMSSLFTRAVKIAEKRNPKYLCVLLDKLTPCIYDNEEIRKISCDFCK
ncbi:MAG: hypothetical protein H6Q25_1053 [Bacteroidetes bacterium]|nr:hypothetical protein [Bacteroidota bacterium]